MTLKNIMASTAVATLLAGCSASAGSDEKILDKPEFTSATGVFGTVSLNHQATAVEREMLCVGSGWRFV